MARSSTGAGIWCRMHGKPGEKRENWLLIKGDDEFARSADEADILEERPESINTGRTIDELEGEAPGWSSKTGKIEKPDGAGRPARPEAEPDPPTIEGAVRSPPARLRRADAGDAGEVSAHRRPMAA